jgi:hypothetical protein
MQSDPRQATGTRALWSSTMNTLELIRSKILKTKHLEDAQMLMAKSYRGVAYVDAHHDEPTASSEPKDLTYRGHHYVH